MKKREKKTGNKFVLYNKSLTFAPLSTESLCIFETMWQFLCKPNAEASLLDYAEAKPKIAKQKKQCGNFCASRTQKQV